MEEMVASITASKLAYKHFKNDQLKEMLGQRGLKKTGNKAELIKRLAISDLERQARDL